MQPSQRALLVAIAALVVPLPPAQPALRVIPRLLLLWLPGCRFGVEPYVIHTTFQRWWGAGKKARLREFGLWYMDPPEYYGAAGHSNGSDSIVASSGVGGGVGGGSAVGSHGGSGGSTSNSSSVVKFLTYENKVLEFVAAAEGEYNAAHGITHSDGGGSNEAGGDGGEVGPGMRLFERNWLGMAYQLAAFRCAPQLPQPCNCRRRCCSCRPPAWQPCWVSIAWPSHLAHCRDLPAVAGLLACGVPPAAIAVH